MNVLAGGADAPAVQQALEAVPGVSACSVRVQEDGKVLASVSLSASDDVRPELARAVLAHGWDLYGMELLKNSLEDVFRALTVGGEQNEN